MEHDPAIRPKRPRDPFKAAHEIFREAIGEKPRTEPRPKKRPSSKKPAGKPESNRNTA
jgi:hypothetical protein